MRCHLLFSVFLFALHLKQIKGGTSFTCPWNPPPPPSISMSSPSAWQQPRPDQASGNAFWWTCGTMMPLELCACACMCVYLCVFGTGLVGNGEGVKREKQGCEPVQSNKSQLCSGGSSDVCGLDRALRDVHENFEEKKQKKREGFGMRQHAYLLMCREGPKGTMGVSHECDEPSPDNRPTRALCLPEPHWLRVASTTNTFTFF